MTDIGRHEESIRCGRHEVLLDTVGRGTPEGEAVVVVVIGGRDEWRLVPHEPGWLATADPFGHLPQREAEPAKPRYG